MIIRSIKENKNYNYKAGLKEEKSTFCSRNLFVLKIFSYGFFMKRL